MSPNALASATARSPQSNARLVYGSITGFGRTGPYAHVKAYEALVMARTGALWASQAMVEREGPAHVSMPYCSYAASQQLLTGIGAALHERERSGLGQHVEATLVNGLASLGTWNWYLNVITSKFPDAFTPSSPISQSGLPLTPMVFMLLIALSEDGRWLQFSQVQLHLYLEMLKVFDLEWMVQDDEWKDAVWAADTPKTGEFWDRLYEAVQSKTLAEWNAVFENDHDVWAETMRRGSELLDHPQMQHLRAVVEIDDAEHGVVRQPGPIVMMSSDTGRTRPWCPYAGLRWTGAPVRTLESNSAPPDAERFAGVVERRGGAAQRCDRPGVGDILRRAIRWDGAARNGSPGDQG